MTMARTTNLNRRPTLTDVANMAGTSRTAAGKVLLNTGGDRVRVSEDTANKIKQAAEQLDYIPTRAAQQLRGAPSGVVALLASPIAFDYTSYALMMVKLQEFISEQSRHCIVYAFRRATGSLLNDEANRLLYNDLRGRFIDAAVILQPDLYQTQAPLHEILPAHLPQVIIGPKQAGRYQDRDQTTPIRHVTTDYGRFTRDMVERFVHQGRRHIIQLVNNPDSLVNQQRLSGCEDACREAVLKGRLDRWQTVTGALNLYKSEGFDQQVFRWVREEGVDAILANNDQGGIALLMALRRLGISVPEQVAVVGYDNEPTAKFVDPPLCTVDFRPVEHAEVAAQLLGKLLSLNEQTQPDASMNDVTLLPQLIHRGSSG